MRWATHLDTDTSDSRVPGPGQRDDVDSATDRYCPPNEPFHFSRLSLSWTSMCPDQQTQQPSSDCLRADKLAEIFRRQKPDRQQVLRQNDVFGPTDATVLRTSCGAGPSVWERCLPLGCRIRPLAGGPSVRDGCCCCWAASVDVPLIHGDRTAIEHWTEIDVFISARSTAAGACRSPSIAKREEPRAVQSGIYPGLILGGGIPPQVWIPPLYFFGQNFIFFTIYYLFYIFFFL